nr:hypothetical protein [Tanacetum cinerariifolium]
MGCWGEWFGTVQVGCWCTGELYEGEDVLAGRLELLVYVIATCPSSINVNEKLVTFTSMNKSKNVRYAKRNKKKDWKPTGKVFTKDIKLLKLDTMLRDNALVDLRKKFEKAEQERDELMLKLDKFQTSSKNLSQLLASQTTDKTGLSYDNQVFNSTEFDCDELIIFELEVSMPASPVHVRYKSRERYHAVPLPYTRTFMPPKPNLVFHDAPTAYETVPTVLNDEPSLTKPNKDLSQLTRPSAFIIEDWVSESEDEYKGEPTPTQKVPSFVQTSKHVKTPRPYVKPVEHPIPAENLRKDIPKSRGHRHSWNRKTCFL